MSANIDMLSNVQAPVSGIGMSFASKYDERKGSATFNAVLQQVKNKRGPKSKQLMTINASVPE